ncbi:MAG: hypothetical protein GX447_08135 [Elusimicrobia bacterium]|nr:hypothetical protein [Elusimicrobiota bacterium]
MPEIIEKYYSLKELWSSLNKLNKSRKYLAGGTDLTISLSYGEEKTELWIDISDIKELSLIEDRKEFVFIGAGIKVSQLENNPIVKKWVPALAESVKYYASPSIRNTATLGGNYVNASPCADGVLALAASQASVVLNLKNRRRTLPLLSIIKGPKKIDLKKDEIAEGFLVPKIKHEAVFYKMMARKRFGISKAGLCICYRANNKKLEYVSIALSSVAPSIVKAPKTEEFLKNKKIDQNIVKKACEIIKSEISPIDDIRSQAEYRKEIISVFLQRALQKTIG